ncbi:MAG: hypothetical protein EON52_16625 [Actinomycetales bacterium]|nr:MAG: hypothetical protein EON52_16625 [Actinomycetales bacterium]
MRSDWAPAKSMTAASSSAYASFQYSPTVPAGLGVWLVPWPQAVAVAGLKNALYAVSPDCVRRKRPWASVQMGPYCAGPQTPSRRIHRPTAALAAAVPLAFLTAKVRVERRVRTTSSAVVWSAAMVTGTVLPS